MVSDEIDDCIHANFHLCLRVKDRALTLFLKECSLNTKKFMKFSLFIVFWKVRNLESQSIKLVFFDIVWSLVYKSLWNLWYIIKDEVIVVIVGKNHVNTIIFFHVR